MAKDEGPHCGTKAAPGWRIKIISKIFASALADEAQEAGVEQHAGQAPQRAQRRAGQHIARVMGADLHARDAHQARERVQAQGFQLSHMKPVAQHSRQEHSLGGVSAGKGPARLAPANHPGARKRQEGPGPVGHELDRLHRDPQAERAKRNLNPGASLMQEQENVG